MQMATNFARSFWITAKAPFPVEKSVENVEKSVENVESYVASSSKKYPTRRTVRIFTRDLRCVSLRRRKEM
jgi:hypothetical protein